MKEINLGGLRLNIRATGIDEAIEKLEQLNKLLKEANSLVNELASTEVSVKFVDLESEQEQADS